MDLLSNLNYVEVFGFLTGVVCVWLYTRENVWAWPIGLVNSVVYVVVFFEARLYADMGLYVIYAALSIYGWYEWLRGGPQHDRLSISRITPVVALVLLGLVILSVAGLSYGLRTYTDAALPFWDSLTTAMSLAAQWMLAKKIFETWIVWITVDVLSAIGSANLKLGRLGQAEEVLRRAIEEDKGFVPAWNNLGVVLMEKGAFGEAERVFRTAFALDNGESDAIRQNLNTALAKLENPAYDAENNTSFALVRRGRGEYRLLTNQ